MIVFDLCIDVAAHPSKQAKPERGNRTSFGVGVRLPPG